MLAFTRSEVVINERIKKLQVRFSANAICFSQDKGSLKNHMMKITKYFLWIIGAGLWVLWINAHWAAPRLVSIDQEWIYPGSTIETWLIRSLFVTIFIAALYREWASSKEDNFPPYNPFVLLLLLSGYFMFVYAFVKYM